MELIDGLTGKGGRGCGMTQIIRQRESLILYRSFNTLCSKDLTHPFLLPSACIVRHILAAQREEKVRGKEAGQSAYEN
jgi:hypothetical protein